MSTLVKVTCVSKKETQSFQEANPVQTVLEFAVPYGSKSIFQQLSGGTTLNLMTINKEAADQFELGKSYDIVISPSEI